MSSNQNESQKSKKAEKEGGLTESKQGELRAAKRVLNTEQSILEKNQNNALGKENTEQSNLKRTLGEKTDLILEKEKRSQYAEALLGHITLGISEAIELSQPLKKKVVLEFKGRYYLRLKSLAESRDWFGLLNSLNSKSQYDELSNIEAIKYLVEKGLYGQNLNILLRFSEMPYKTIARIRFIRLNKLDLSAILDDSYQWWGEPNIELHPDGIGYLIDWRPHEGPLLIFELPKEEGFQLMDNNISATRYLRQNLEKKYQLGEIDKPTMNIRLDAAEKKLCQEIVSWARKH